MKFPKPQIFVKFVLWEKFRKSLFQNRSNLEKVYSDVIGRVSPPSIGGNRNAIIFVDEFIYYAAVKFMKYKTQALQTFK